MLFIYFKAPFGAFKPFQSIEMLATVEFMTYSAAYGFLLGLAGINSRDPLVKSAYINTRIALGTFNLPRKGRVLQQLHKGKPGSDNAERVKGRKPKIDVFWRELLYDSLEGYIGLDNPELEPLVIQGINNPQNLDYWGLPFMGDNNFFIERLDIVQETRKCEWFTLLNSNTSPNNQRLYYLSVWTDYQDSRNSKSLLFQLIPSKETTPLDLDSDTWVMISPMEA
jgi:CRISPR-associated protein Cas5t